MKDEELVKELMNPDSRREAFSRLVSLYSKQLYWQVRRLVVSHDDADDIVQNTFLKVWINIEFFRGEAKLSSWLYRIATNESLTFLSQKGRTPQTISSEEASSIVDNLEGDQYFDGEEVDRHLQIAIAELPDKQRAVFLLRFYEEMKYEEMAEVLDTSVGALKASYHHAAKKIEEKMKQLL